jgi:hypothetical protein
VEPDKSVGEPAVISVGDIECKPIDTDDDSLKAGNWNLVTEGDKALGGVVDGRLTPENEGEDAGYLESTADDLVEPDFSQASWGKALE